METTGKEKGRVGAGEGRVERGRKSKERKRKPWRGSKTENREPKREWWHMREKQSPTVENWCQPMIHHCTYCILSKSISSEWNVMVTVALGSGRVRKQCPTESTPWKLTIDEDAGIGESHILLAGFKLRPKSLFSKFRTPVNLILQAPNHSKICSSD